MLSIGIDVHKAQLQIAVHQGAQWRCATTSRHLTALAARLRALQPDVVVLEPSGGYERPVLEALWAAGIPVALVPPRQVRSFIRGLGIQAKADPLDARMLALFGHLTHPRLVPAPSPLQRQVQDLVRYRRSVVADRVRLQHRLGQATTPLIQSRLSARIALLQAEEAALRTEIAALVARVPAWMHQRALLESCPGIGATTSAMLVAEVPELGHLAPKAIAALVGVAPYTHQSGTSADTAHIAGGRAAVRHALWSPTLTAMRHNPVIRAFAARLRARGKPPKVVIIACMRKLLEILNAMLATDEPWSPRPLAA